MSILSNLGSAVLERLRHFAPARVGLFVGVNCSLHQLGHSVLNEGVRNVVSLDASSWLGSEASTHKCVVNSSASSVNSRSVTGDCGNRSSESWIESVEVVNTVLDQLVEGVNLISRCGDIWFVSQVPGVVHHGCGGNLSLNNLINHPESVLLEVVGNRVVSVSSGGRKNGFSIDQITMIMRKSSHGLRENVLSAVVVRSSGNPVGLTKSEAVLLAEFGGSRERLQVPVGHQSVALSDRGQSSELGFVFNSKAGEKVRWGGNVVSSSDEGDLSIKSRLEGGFRKNAIQVVDGFHSEDFTLGDPVDLWLNADSGELAKSGNWLGGSGKQSVQIAVHGLKKGNGTHGRERGDLLIFREVGLIK